MSHTEGVHPLRATFRMLRTLFVLACVLIAAFTVVGYASGWIEVRRDPQQDKAVIEVETGKAKEAARDAVVKGQELAKQAGEKIEQFTAQRAASPATQGEGMVTPEKGSQSEQSKGQAVDAGAQVK